MKENTALQDRMSDFQPVFIDEPETYKYYIGDLCYVLDDEWSEVCEAFFVGDEEDPIYELEDGRTFFMVNTAFGDGQYNDQNGLPYSVDSGSIGAIKVDDIRNPELANVLERGLGHIHEFPYELTDLDIESDNGVLYFGNVIIDTVGADFDEEDPEERDEEEEGA
jgi:hypothetical protein